MGIETVGKVLVAAKVENLSDLYDVEKGTMVPEDVRTIQVDDALVDTGASILGMPVQMIQRLGLRQARTRKARTNAGPTILRVFDAVRLTIQGRDCLSDVTELPDDCPVLIGQIPLEQLDFVVDPGRQKLIGNPEHGGEHIIELY